MTQVITGIEAEIMGHEPIATQTKHLYYVQNGFVLVSNGNIDRITHAKAQKFLNKNAPLVNINKIHAQLLHR